MKKTIILSFLILLATYPMEMVAQKAVTGKPAKELFEKAYKNAFGPQGSTLCYAVNIIGIYKTEGKIYYKGDKSHYEESRYSAWVNGKTAYMVDKKKKTVGIYRADDDKKDEYLAKFKYDVNNFDFSYIDKGSTYELTAKIKDASFFGIKKITAVLDKTTLTPSSLTIKLAIFSTTVKITNFKSGSISDSVFEFPKQRFSDYKFVDHTKDKK